MRSETLKVGPQDHPTPIDILGQHACVDLIENLALVTSASVSMLKREMSKASKILEDMGVIDDPFEAEKTERLKLQV